MLTVGLANLKEFASRRASWNNEKSIEMSKSYLVGPAANWYQLKIEKNNVSELVHQKVFPRNFWF